MLNKIKWDKNENPENYKIGFLDKKKIMVINFNQIIFEEDNKFSFEYYTAKEGLITIPFHRIKQIIKKGKIIWKRKY